MRRAAERSSRLLELRSFRDVDVNERLIVQLVDDNL
jgi:hypothetical protein